MHLPRGHRHFSFFSDMLTELAEGVSAYQDEGGMWHQVLSRPDSYAETSATAMFVLCLARAVTLGVLKDSRFRTAVERGAAALLRCCVDRDGNVYGVCKGSGCSMDADYYMGLETAFCDDHGTGIVLSALAAANALLKPLT